jgi:NMD protein affecting ribosome stability and mRNA decay
MEKVLCYSCNKNKHKLNLKRSNLFPINLLMCETCISSKYEPRWAVILSGRQNGSDSVREYILKKRYVGEEISASELFV